MITEAPHFLFIFGAAGSGNTFMFSCITEDEQVYGVNEDALGSTLERLLDSEKEMGKCPHSLKAYVDFLFALRKDRRTLVLKTPSNLRRTTLLRRHVPNCRFICMLREPHAAIASGLARHHQSVEQVAKIWRDDCRMILDQRDDDFTVVTYEQLVREPGDLLAMIAENVLPLSSRVIAYATRMNRPERSGDTWWREKVSPEICEEISNWVERLGLSEQYSEASGVSGRLVNVKREIRLSTLGRAKRQFFRGWYSVFK